MENFEEIRTKSEEFYKTIGEVYCPYFKEKISFGAQGLEHLKFKRREKTRLEQDQYMRFKLLHLAPEVLKLSRTVQGIWETKHLERIRVNSRTDLILKPVVYYEFIAVLDRIRLKVIAKQIGNGQISFWSIMPSWGINNETRERKLYGGNPQED